MNSGAIRREARRRHLVARSSALRAGLILELAPLSHRLRAVDGAMRILAHLRRHPEWLAGAALALALLKPRRVSNWLRGLRIGLRTWRQLAPHLQRFTH